MSDGGPNIFFSFCFPLRYTIWMHLFPDSHNTLQSRIIEISISVDLQMGCVEPFVRLSGAFVPYRQAQSDLGASDICRTQKCWNTPAHAKPTFLVFIFFLGRKFPSFFFFFWTYCYTFVST